jgi:putative transposase
MRPHFVGPRFSAAAQAQPTLPSRKNIRLSAQNYIGRRVYFVTLCFYRRQRFGADPRIAPWLSSTLQRVASVKSFFVHAWCVMPDHLHFLTEGAGETSNLLDFVGSFKQSTAFAFARRRHRRLWQFKFYDHILRRADAIESVAWYIWLNPVRKGVCGSPADYPFLGSFTETGLAILRAARVPVWTPPWKHLPPL